MPRREKLQRRKQKRLCIINIAMGQRQHPRRLCPRHKLGRIGVNRGGQTQPPRHRRRPGFDQHTRPQTATRQGQPGKPSHIGQSHHRRLPAQRKAQPAKALQQQGGRGLLGRATVIDDAQRIQRHFPRSHHAQHIATADIGQHIDSPQAPPAQIGPQPPTPSPADRDARQHQQRRVRCLRARGHG